MLVQTHSENVPPAFLLLIRVECDTLLLPVCLHEGNSSNSNQYWSKSKNPKWLSLFKLNYNSRDGIKVRKQYDIGWRGSEVHLDLSPSPPAKYHSVPVCESRPEGPPEPFRPSGSCTERRLLDREEKRQLLPHHSKRKEIKNKNNKTMNIYKNKYGY